MYWRETRQVVARSGGGWGAGRNPFNTDQCSLLHIGWHPTSSWISLLWAKVCSDLQDTFAGQSQGEPFSLHIPGPQQVPKQRHRDREDARHTKGICGSLRTISSPPPITHIHREAQKYNKCISQGRTMWEIYPVLAHSITMLGKALTTIWILQPWVRSCPRGHCKLPALLRSIRMLLFRAASLSKLNCLQLQRKKCLAANGKQNRGTGCPGGVLHAHRKV